MDHQWKVVKPDQSEIPFNSLQTTFRVLSDISTSCIGGVGICHQKSSTPAKLMLCLTAKLGCLFQD